MQGPEHPFIPLPLTAVRGQWTVPMNKTEQKITIKDKAKLIRIHSSCSLPAALDGQISEEVNEARVFFERCVSIY